MKRVLLAIGAVILVRYCWTVAVAIRQARRSLGEEGPLSSTKDYEATRTDDWFSA